MIYRSPTPPAVCFAVFLCVSLTHSLTHTHTHTHTYTRSYPTDMAYINATHLGGKEKEGRPPQHTHKNCGAQGIKWGKVCKEMRESPFHGSSSGKHFCLIFNLPLMRFRAARLLILPLLCLSYSLLYPPTHVLQTHFPAAHPLNLGSLSELGLACLYK